MDGGWERDRDIEWDMNNWVMDWEIRFGLQSFVWIMGLGSDFKWGSMC